MTACQIQADPMLDPLDSPERVAVYQELNQVIDNVADKWAVLIVGHLTQSHALRFGELMRLMPGISQRRLATTLRNLEREGILTRLAHCTVPPRVDYRLTELGRSLSMPLALLSGWAMDKHQDIACARRRYDAQDASILDID